MNVFARIKYAIDERKINNFVRLYQMAKMRAEFKPEYASIINEVTTSERFSTSIAEKCVWYIGNPDILRQFFSKGQYRPGSSIKYNLFWEKAPASYRFVHSNIPSLISKKMATVLFGKGYDFTTDVYQVDETTKVVNKTKRNDILSDSTHEAAVALLDKMGISNILTKAASTESWCGHVILKHSVDTTISNYPILEVYDLRNAEPMIDRGITTAIVFKKWYEKATGLVGVKRRYRLDEIYRTFTEWDGAAVIASNEALAKAGSAKKIVQGTPEVGDAVIEYVLYELTRDGEVAIDLGSLDETRSLVKFTAFPGLKGLLAYDKPNRLPNNEFPDLPFGASDYAGATTPFDALDEIASEIVSEVRDNKTRVFFPANLLPKDANNGSMFGPDPFQKTMVQMPASYAENAKNEITAVEIKDKTEQHIAKWKQAIAQAVNCAGISPLTLGITGLEAINAGEESQRERNKVTLETRSAKIELWAPFLANVIVRSLEFNSYLQQAKIVEQADIPLMDIDFSNCNVRVTFPDYIVNTDRENVDTWGLALQQGIIDRAYALEKILPKASKSERDAITQRAAFEQGQASDNPNALNFGNLIGGGNPGGNPEPGRK